MLAGKSNFDKKTFLGRKKSFFDQNSLLLEKSKLVEFTFDRKVKLKNKV